MLDRSIHSLEKMCRDFLKNEYDVDLNIPVRINKRLSRSLGRFVITRYNTNNRIEFANFLLKDGTDDQIISVLRHECIHYALYTLNKDYRDGQKEFEDELKKHNSDSTNSISVEKNNDAIDKRLADSLNVSLTKTVSNVFDKIAKNQYEKV